MQLLLEHERIYIMTCVWCHSLAYLLYRNGQELDMQENETKYVSSFIDRLVFGLW